MFQKFWGVIFFLAFSPAAWAYDFEVNGIYYNILSSDDKTVEVTDGDGPRVYSDKVTIPATVMNEGIEYRVTAIGERAFVYCSGLTSVTIPESVTTIGERAFRSCDLTSVTIPESVTTIGDMAFSVCTGLTSVTIGDGVTTIGKEAFRECYHLTSVTIPENVTTIGDYAFRDCRDLTSVTIGKNVQTIGDGAFFCCEALTSVTIGKNVTTIGEAAFEGCASLPSVTIPESVTVIGKSAFFWCRGLMSVTVYNPTPVNIDEKSVFYLVDCDNCTLYVPAESIELYKAAEGWKNFLNIKYKIDGIGYDILSSDERTAKVINGGYSGDIVIPETMEYEGITYRVTAIGDYAFEYCYALTSVTIPESVTSIGEEAFYGCSGLTEFKGKFAVDNCCLIVNDTLKAFAPKCDVAEYTIPDDVKVIGEEAFEDCQNLTSVTIPNSVTAIGGWAFAYCTGLTSVTIGKNVQTIGEAAFEYCYDLTSVTIPNSVITIDGYAFSRCYSLMSVTIPNSVTTIGDRAFWYCESLTSVTIGKNVQTIGDQAFKYCENLTSVTAYNPEPVDIGTSVFDGVDNGKLYVPKGSVEAYRNAEGWSEFGEILPIDESSAIMETEQEQADEHITVYNLQGVPVLETDDATDLKTLQNGAYIVNGKKMIIAR